MENNRYPDCLIPKVNYIRQIPLNDFYTRGSFFTQRRASCSQEECVDEFGEVTEKALYDTTKPADKAGDELNGMSVNMMGTPHLPEYGKWIQQNPGSKHWDEKEVSIDTYEGKYYHNADQAFVYLNCKGLEGRPIPYTMIIANREIFDKYKEVAGVYGKAFSSTEPYHINGIIRHLHEPTFLNYWHAELWLNPDDKFITKDLRNKPDWKLNLKRKFIEALRANATVTLPDMDWLPEGCQLKTVV